MKKLLVANRGEIALRIMKTAKEMGIRTVAVYSDADRGAPHVKFSDEAAYLGASPSSESYLAIDKILAVASEFDVDAIHPGYGFLSENADFAEAVTGAGLIFVGPRPDAIRVMGSKLAAKEAVKDYDIPLVPGTDHPVEDIEEAERIAAEIGFPILIKASAGGGGKGMRIVHKADDLKPQMERAVSEAKSAFGDGAVFIEKYIGSPRHIEVQVMADSHGHIIHLFERECSIQRRHQKVVEEAPSSVLSPDLRKEMGEAAIRVAKSCNYLGAGTVEFLLDENNKFYFLEMNTRLQVEHPVTELITGLDLVALQIQIARGEPLGIGQEEVRMHGHAIELRVYAEDPANDFLPSVGRLKVYSIPEGEGIRVDGGYEEGMEVPIYYDPMLAKLVVHAGDRIKAIAKMKEAIAEFTIKGVATTLPFGDFVMNHEAFISGDFDTHFVKSYFSAETLVRSREEASKIAAMAGLKLYTQERQKLRLPN